jgi:3-methyladenine DNA glycosylase/8-oxoguanine DNA glycosylase
VTVRVTAGAADLGAGGTAVQTGPPRACTGAEMAGGRAVEDDGRVGATKVDLVFRRRPDLAASMEVQVPALAWQRTGTGGYARLLYPQGRPVRVEVRVAGQALRFHLGPTDQVDWLRAALTVMFRRQVGDLHLGRHPALLGLRAHYRGVVVMRTVDPFEALVLTVLAQNRSARAVREVYRDLVAAAGGTGPARFASLDRQT